jgi:hypothetical protein
MARLALLRELAVRLGVAVAAEASGAATLPVRRRLGDGDLRAALLLALLRAAGERATLELTREMPLVRVSVAIADVRRLPPWARLARTVSGSLEVVVTVDVRWSAAGYVAPDVRAALDRRRPFRNDALAS